MNVLIVDRPSAFRDALVSAMRARGADVHESDGALDALGKLRELAPRVIVVSDTSGPPDVASTARLMRRQLGQVSVYHLHDPASGVSAPDTVSLSRHGDVSELARALIGDASGSDPKPASAPPESMDAEEPIDELLELASEPEEVTARPARPAPPAPAPPAPPVPTPPADARTPLDVPVVACTPNASPDDGDRDTDARLLSEIEPLMHQGRWSELVELVGKREPDPQRLSPRIALLFAVALKEAPTSGAAAGLRPTADPDLLGIRAVAQLLRMDSQSTTALLIAKRVLRKRPLEWQREPPRRVSLLLTLIALALGAAVGLVFDQQLIALLRP